MVVGVAAVVLVLPDLFGLDHRTPFAQLVWLRPYLLLPLSVVLLVLGVLAARRPRVLWPTVVVLAVVVVVGAVLVVPRFVPTAVPDGGRSITVVAFNTFNGAAAVDEVAALLREERPDVVALVEAGESFRSRLAPLVEPAGYRLITEVGPAGDDDVNGVTVAVAAHLGEVRSTRIRGMPFPAVQVEGGGLGPLRFVAYHSVAPRYGDVWQWRADLQQVPRWCGGGGPAVVAGDFNATLDYSLLRSATRGCSNAADQRGQGLVPSWPSWLPDWVGPQIDHVFATDPIVAEHFAMREITGSDHRAVIARLRLPA
ncbi:endonuclease/exonuclease/phosphatase family protein [Pseudonocardia humida]|uniref:Endonuclease/exonuclease/phosphatase family protein n=1 Tax=Pseudonocardia humida TaxID=2800819 RepID=A0ABT0ZXH6_9PSEU|nr:endonuclease/exonuclease/phosphatase family protein [Pseudonocardia humida]MCO1655324.1 endonuclease/exonuclease/phosphatase family protein [Pseudonocardia humida]